MLYTMFVYLRIHRALQSYCETCTMAPLYIILFIVSGIIMYMYIQLLVYTNRVFVRNKSKCHHFHVGGVSQPKYYIERLTTCCGGLGPCHHRHSIKKCSILWQKYWGGALPLSLLLLGSSSPHVPLPMPIHVVQTRGVDL